MKTTGEKTVGKGETPPPQIIQEEGRTRLFIDQDIEYIRRLFKAQDKTFPYDKEFVDSMKNPKALLVLEKAKVLLKENIKNKFNRFTKRKK
jgi:hypothetical protein